MTGIDNPFRFNPERSWRLSGRAVLLLLSLGLGACAPTLTQAPAETADNADDNVPVTEQVADAPADQAKAEKAPIQSPRVELTSELLYDVLVASVANQRNQPKVALDALVRAVYLSRDKRLNANAIELALHLRDYQKAIELSRLLLTQDPGNFRVVLALATAQVRSDKTDDAAKTLMDLLREQEVGDEPVMQEVASLIARQKASHRDALRERLDAAVADGEPVIVFTSALLASRLEESERFRELLEQVLESTPDWETAAILKLTDIADRERKKMDAWARRFLKSHPEANRFHIQYARLLIQDDRLDDALDAFESVLELDPESTDALFAAAVVNMDLENREAAESLFRRYITVSNNGDQARIYLSQMLIDQERYDDASPLLRQVQSSQHYLEAQVMLSTVIARQSNVEAGLSFLRNISARGEDETVRLILEQDLLLRDFDLMERSLELLSEALIERPEHPDLLYSRGLLAAQLNQIDLIERDMRLLIELQPENAHAYNALGYTLADQTDRYDEAQDLIAKALEFLPEDPYILDSMGWVKYRKGDKEGALEYLEKAWNLKKDAEIAAHLGEVLWILGRESDARKIWKEGKEAAPDNATLLKTIDRFLEAGSDQQAVWLKPSDRRQSTMAHLAT